jgi:hypothetical protein
VHRRPTALLAAAVVALAVLAPAAAAGPRCAPLLVDAAGDADWMASGGAAGKVEDGRVVDLLSSDLVSDRRALAVTMRVTGRNAEGGTDTLDHAWETSFSTATERFSLEAYRSRTGGDSFVLWRVVAGDDVPQDEEGAGASAAQGVAANVTGSIDEVKGVVRMSVPVTAFAEWGGLGRELTRVRAIGWSGVAAFAPDTPVSSGGGAGTHSSADFGSTKRAYAVGARGCS